MQRYGRTVLLKDDPEVIRRYEDYHAHVWPEVEASLRSAGITRMLIFRFARTLLMYMETVDGFRFEHTPTPAERDPRAVEWENLMRSFQEPVPGAPSDGTWVTMPEIFTFPAGS
ncbi:MAG: L-rhamnose mutarotase [Actinobacteria bacterium]|nr:L-rhamnose mutarotase [Actinomycetota bacterium]